MPPPDFQCLPLLSFPTLQGPSPISLFSIDHEGLLGQGMSGPVIANTKVSQESGAGKCFDPAGPVARPQVRWVPGAWLLPIPSWCWQETEVRASREQRLLLLHLINLLLIVANGILQFPRPSPGAMAAPREGG